MERRAARGDEPARIISEQVAQELAAILERVVVEGTGKAAAVAGFSAAGKTGTTQIYDPGQKSYQSSKHIGSFVGFVPAEKPALSIIVVLGDPKKDDYYGGLVAAPVFREIAVRSLRAKGLFPRPDVGRTIIAANTGKGKRP
jgi:cell division protein FtsI/penicillin-binding protein 2